MDAEKLAESKNGRRRGEACGMEEFLEENPVESKSICWLRLYPLDISFLVCLVVIIPQWPLEEALSFVTRAVLMLSVGIRRVRMETVEL